MRTVAGAPHRTIATFDDYAEAQRAVDHLSDQGFPVERTAIVGHGLRYVEQVAGRITTGRAALLANRRALVVVVIKRGLAFELIAAGEQHRPAAGDDRHPHGLRG